MLYYDSRDGSLTHDLPEDAAAVDQALLRHGDAKLPFDHSGEVVASPPVARLHNAAGAAHGSHGDLHPMGESLLDG